jgi:hypothetical protein
MNALEREIFRLLMTQISEEQALRVALIRVLLGEEAAPISKITDMEVDARIAELSEIATNNLKNNLTNKKNGSSI